VFLDRDGTIIEDQDYPGDPDGVRLLPGAALAIAKLNSTGLPVIVITNQSGIARGLITHEQYVAVQGRMEDLLLAAGARVTATYFCPHGPETAPPCDCRKPRPGLYRQAAEDHEIDLSRSFYVGDRVRDVAAGIAAGGTGYLIRPGADSTTSEMPAHAIPVKSLQDAVERLLESGLFD
jgi:histidinol-phosphate phosphatase family protein